MSRRAGLWLLIGALAFAPSLRADEKLPNQFQIAYRLYKQGETAKALEAFDLHTRNAPRDWHGHFYKAVCLATLAQHDADAAHRASLFQQAWAAHSNTVKSLKNRFSDPMVLYLSGVIHSLAGQWIDAYVALDKARRAPRINFERYKGIDLKKNINEAFAITSMKRGQRDLTRGNFEGGDLFLQQADKILPKDHRERPELEQNLAAIDEALSRYDSAVEHLRNCQSVYPPERKDEFAAVIATIYLRTERIEEGAKVLEEIAADSKDPDVIAARALVFHHAGMEEPEEPVMDRAINHYRTILKDHPEKRRYGLTLELSELILEKIRPLEAPRYKALIEEQIQALLKQIERRPECPKAYYYVSRLYKLLRDGKKEHKFKVEHDRKTREFESRERYDRYGRPLCR